MRGHQDERTPLGKLWRRLREPEAVLPYLDHPAADDEGEKGPRPAQTGILRAASSLFFCRIRRSCC